MRRAACPRSARSWKGKSGTSAPTARRAGPLSTAAEQEIARTAAPRFRVDRRARETAAIRPTLAEGHVRARGLPRRPLPAAADPSPDQGTVPDKSVEFLSSGPLEYEINCLLCQAVEGAAKPVAGRLRCTCFGFRIFGNNAAGGVAKPFVDCMHPCVSFDLFLVVTGCEVGNRSPISVHEDRQRH